MVLSTTSSKRQPHGQLGKDVVERYREGKMQPVDCECAVHLPLIMHRPEPGGRPPIHDRAKVEV